MEAVVIDPGSHTVKAGYASYNTPVEMVPSVVIPPCVESEEPGTIGGTPRYCIERGAVTNLEHYEALLHYILYERLGWPIGDEGNLLYAESLFTSKAEREDICQLMFEVFNVSGLFFCDQALLSLYVCGRQSGCVIDFGHGTIDVATVTDGQLYTPGVRRLEFAGQDMTTHLRDLLKQRGYSCLSDADLERLKESVCAVAGGRDEYEQLQRKGEATAEKHTLPDGQEIVVGSEGYILGESLFSPNILLGGAELPGISDSLYAGIVNNHEPSVRKFLYEHILLSGGGSKAPGLSERLLRESRVLAPPSISPSQTSWPDYMPETTQSYAAWMGGAILAKVVFPQNHHMTRAEYDERGPTAAHGKCG